MVGREVLLTKPKHHAIYPYKKNEFMVPYHEKKGDYYVNLYLSKLTNELWF